MQDYFLSEDNFSEEEKLMQKVTRRFVDEEVIPLLPDAYEKGHFPKHLILKLAELGLFGVTLPEEWGCANASQVAYGLVCQELERGDSGLRSFVSVQSSLCMYPIYAFGSENQKKKYLPKMAKGKLIGCFGLTESDSGSDPASMKTRATKVKGGWKLNGTKMWITNATLSDLAIIWAKTDEGKICGFIVEKGSKGFSTNEIKHKLSLRVSDTGEVILEDCFVPEDQILPNAIKGLQDPLSCLTKARYGIAWGAMGAAIACYEAAVNYTQTRVSFNKPIASFQLVQKDLVDMLNEILKAQALNYQVGRLQETNKDYYVFVSLAKMNACREALKIARLARNLLGANGISLDYHVMRHMNNLESVFTYEGTDNMHHLIVGRYITGLSAFG
ncbi:MAG TPA: acyl-CoA dehydrogenase family protein [Gammaproteobacteria bacterium]|nr:acyl-CoA dehydrogenase family protein [Gammaproteobacteria bacterium]